MKNFLDYIGLTEYDQLIKNYVGNVLEVIKVHIGNKGNPHSVTKEQVGLTNVEDKSSETIRGEITYSNIVNGLGYIPAEASDLSVYKFEIANGDLMITYPDDSPAPEVHIDTSGNLIWSYVE